MAGSSASPYGYKCPFNSPLADPGLEDEGNASAQDHVERQPDNWSREINGVTVEFSDGGSVVEGSLSFGSTSSRVRRNKVVCRYDKPTRTAWLCLGGKGEETAKAVSGCFRTGIYKIMGNKVKCGSPALTDNAWLVRVFGIPSCASKQQIMQDIPRVLRPKHISLDEWSFTDDLPSNNKEIKRLLKGEAGKVISLEPVTHPGLADDDRYGVIAEFNTAADAMRALQLDGSTLEFDPNGTLTVDPVYAAWIKVSSLIWNAAAWDADSQEDYRELLRRVSITEYPLPGEECQLVLIEGLIREKVVAAKKTLEAILHGEVVEENGTAVWMPFSEDDGRRLWQSIRGLERIVVIRDPRMCQLRLVGDLSQRMEAKTRLIKIANESKLSSTHKFDLTSQGGNCVICLTEAEDPVQTSCGHTFCRGCLYDLCAHCARNEEKGIRCAGPRGKDGTCNFAFPLVELKRHLSAPKLEAILEIAFDAYVSRTPDKLRFCPTPDCGHVYQVSPNRPEDGDSAPTHPCTRCLVPVCTWCHVPAHAGVTCDEQQDMMTGGYRALARAKMELGIRDCPHCKTLIEKNGGCNKVRCGSCKIHICWQCMKTFGPGHSEACYLHMQRVHGSIGVDQFYYPELAYD